MNHNETKTQTHAAGPERTRVQKTRTPHVDIYENEHELLLVADLPGVDRDALKLAIEPPELRLETTPKSESEAGFSRSFSIDERIAAAEVSAELEQGVLKVRLPKAPSLRPRQIPIRTGS